MGQVLHGCARTTEAVRRAIQDSQASLNVLAARYGINPKTIAQWRQRQNVQDSPMGPKLVRSSVLTPEEGVFGNACASLADLPSLQKASFCRDGMMYAKSRPVSDVGNFLFLEALLHGLIDRSRIPA